MITRVYSYLMMCLLMAVLSFAFARPIHAEFVMKWEGTRQWAGPEVWASPIYDWRVEDGKLIVEAAPQRLLQNTIWRVNNPKGDLYMETAISFQGLDQIKNKKSVWAGFAVGIHGLMDDPRHILVGPKKRINAGVRGDGAVFIGQHVSKQKVALSNKIFLLLVYNETGLQIHAFDETDPKKERRPIATAEYELEKNEIKGNIALAAHSREEGKAGASTVNVVFDSWSARGGALARQQQNVFGPILWTQYTRQGNKVKLLAMLAPMGEKDPKNVLLQTKQNGEWKTIDKQEYDPLTYSALLRATVPDGDVPYRVCYKYLGKDRYWYGTFIPDPATTGEPLKIGVFSCDHGYAFPLPTMVKNVKHHKPNLVFFAGDQIYENYGGFKLKRTPTKLAMLDYLRKYYQFGWTWRDVLANTPSIIIPDDHDVFQGNIWGAGGKWTKNINDGGYVMHPDWINGVQRTQTAHLPDAYDPTPVKRGIGVYYTDFNWGGVPIAVIEDRKWKTGPNSVLPKGDKTKLTPAQKDPAGAQLLGKRQEDFLLDWSKRTADQPRRLILSQTIFCKGTTHAGPELKKNYFVTDTNGWPRSGRQRALAPFKDGKTVMLHGDQHMGLLVRHGIDEHNDGPYAFMVPGTSNGYPRAWWPDINNKSKVKGDFVDPFGNPFSVLAAANPEPGTNKIKTYNEGHPEKSAHVKGSGYGLVVIDPKTHAVTFNMYRYLFDAAKPEKGDQFPGFPVTIGAD